MSRQRGASRERDVARLLREDGYVAFTTKNDGQTEIDEHGRRRPSHGIVDVIAAKLLSPTSEVSLEPIRGEFHLRVIQVKTTAGGPYERFGPHERAKLAKEARLAGAEAELWWWPPRAPQPTVIPSGEWPPNRMSFDDPATGRTSSRVPPEDIIPLEAGGPA